MVAGFAGLCLSKGLTWQRRPKLLEILVTFAGVTNNASGEPLVTFRISNPYLRTVFYVPGPEGVALTSTILALGRCHFED
jgi:hypothetical protein